MSNTVRTIPVKIKDGRAYIIKGDMGIIGFSAMSYAASIRDQVGVKDFPLAIEKKDFDLMSYDKCTKADVISYGDYKKGDYKKEIK